jgi:GalNAc-alpha-(1->4)-GalNAc-alpha-(1->3)-diNAcBac-PP-undecaprenol alpha-1,4-N-acetyl-D-galactosaminyltransferase
MRIAFILPHFGIGGAERVASLLCNYWVQQGHSVTAITFETPGTQSAHPLDNRVARYQTDVLNRSQALLSRVATNARRLYRIRSAIRESDPDVIVAFTTEANVVAIWSGFGLGIPVIVSERNQPDRPGLGQWRRIARQMTYPLAAAVVVQTEAIAKWAKQHFGVPVHVLPNPVCLSAQPEVRDSHSAKRLVAVGRLVRQKGFDFLIESFVGLAAKHPDWTLTIYGEGEERVALDAQIQRSAFADRIKLAGVSTEMVKVYADADLFVLPSRFEGYPNALLEALAAGCPVVATNCPGATSEILDHGRYGILVDPENVAALTQGLDRMMSRQDSRAEFALQARSAVSELDVASVGSRWLELFSSLSNDLSSVLFPTHRHSGNRSK